MVERNRAWLLVLQHSEKLVHNFGSHVHIAQPVCLERALERCYESVIRDGSDTVGIQIMQVNHC